MVWPPKPLIEAQSYGMQIRKRHGGDQRLVREVFERRNGATTSSGGNLNCMNGVDINMSILETSTRAPMWIALELVDSQRSSPILEP